MADYNIYIRTIGGGESSSPTTPTQLGGGDGGNATATASQFISKAGAFAQNPDSAIGAVGSTAVGVISRAVPWVGVAIIAATTILKVGDNVYSKYNDLFSSMTGDYRNRNRYNNFKQGIHNFTHPFSMVMSFIQQTYEERAKNKALEQERLLTGGTILNSQYGRYL